MTKPILINKFELEEIKKQIKELREKGYSLEMIKRIIQNKRSREWIRLVIAGEL